MSRKDVQSKLDDGVPSFSEDKLVGQGAIMMIWPSLYAEASLGKYWQLIGIISSLSNHESYYPTIM